jgi:hypothetical protein
MDQQGIFDQSLKFAKQIFQIKYFWNSNFYITDTHKKVMLEFFFTIQQLLHYEFYRNSTLCLA